MKSDWVFNLDPRGWGNITYKGEPILDATKVVITCAAGQPTTAQIEVRGVHVNASLASVEATRKIEVKFSVMAGRDTISPEDLDVIQTLSAKYGFSLGRLVEALMNLKVAMSQDVAYLAVCCSHAKEEGVEIDFWVHRNVAMLKKLEGA